MIRSTFCIINGVGEKLERKIWRSGVLTWSDFMSSSRIEAVSSDRKKAFDERLSDAAGKLESGDSRYFLHALDSTEQWRLYKAFRGETAFLDIETNGLPAGAGGYTTVVGVYDGRRYKTFIRGENLGPRRLSRELSSYKLLVSFYGTVFDVPFLRRSLPGFDLDIPHFDLCFGARRIGMRGGLKRIEGALGIERAEEARGMNGYDAVKLWNRARNGNSRAMDLLVKYNREDTVNLQAVADAVYRGLRSATGIEQYMGADA